MINKIKQFISYFWGKKSELSAMDEKDALLAKTVMDIHRKRSHSTFELVPLYALHPIHPINRDSALEATRKRAEILAEEKEELVNRKRLDREVLGKYIPSVSAIKVVQVTEKAYVAYEGNGRLYALQQVFNKEDGIEIEVELYHFSSPEKIIRRINRVRKLHGLTG